MVDDEQLMEEVRGGDVGQLEILFERHSTPLFRFFLHLTGDHAKSEDLVQEAFLRVLKFRHTWHAQTTFRAWLFQVGRNAYMDDARRHRSESPLPEAAAELASGEMPADRRLERSEQAAMVRRALAGLPPDRREVLILSRYLDWKYREIAAALECEVGTVKGRVYRAMRELGDRFAALTEHP